MGNSEAKPIEKAQWPRKYARYADFRLETSDHYEFPVSRAILSKENEIFAGIFFSSKKGVGKAFLPDVTGEGLFEVLMFLYEGKTTGNFPNVVDEVYCAAAKFHLDELKKTCEDLLLSQMSVESVCNTIDLAKKFGLNGLFAASLFFIRDHREDPQMPWSQLGKFCTGEGKFLKEMVMVAADDSYVPQL